jgi:hypothetical protein
MDYPEFQMGEKRYLVSLPVSSEKYGMGTRANLRMRNLSKTGAMLHILRSVEFLKKGDLLRLTVDLYEIQKKKVVNAEIVWQEKDKIGVSFVMPDDVIKRLFRQVG